MKKFFCVSLSILVLFTISCQSNKNYVLKDMFAGYYEVAEEFYNLKKYDKAIEYYEKCMKDPNPEMRNAVSYKLAKCYIQQNKYKEALDIFQEILNQDQENISMKTSIAYCYVKLYEFDKAEKIYLSILETDPDNQGTHKNLILLNIAKNDFENAENLIQNYKTKYPLDETIQTIVSECDKRKKAYNEALIENSKSKKDKQNSETE